MCSLMQLTQEANFDPLECSKELDNLPVDCGVLLMAGFYLFVPDNEVTIICWPLALQLKREGRPRARQGHEIVVWANMSLTNKSLSRQNSP